MKSIFFILINPKKGLEILDNEFEDNLLRRSVVIFGLLGLMKHFSDFIIGHKDLGFLFNFMNLFLAIGLNIVFGILMGFLLYKLGKWLGGKGSFIEIIVVLAYSYIPLIFLLIISTFISTAQINIPNQSIIVFYLSWLFLLRILVIGLIKFHQISIFKALLNSSPIILLGLIIIFILQL